MVLSSFTYAFTYIGSKELCCIDDNNKMSCLYNNNTLDNTNITDLTCNLYDANTDITVNNAMTLLDKIVLVFECGIIVMIVLIIFKK